jgi:hypothetical protein
MARLEKPREFSSEHELLRRMGVGLGWGAR